MGGYGDYGPGFPRAGELANQWLDACTKDEKKQAVPIRPENECQTADNIYDNEEMDTGEVSDDDAKHDEKDDNDTSDEVIECKVCVDPGRPTKEEKEKHDATHAQYRSWCPSCVMGRGQSSPHKSKEKKKDPRGLPEISMNYHFAGEKDDPTATMLAIKDGKSKAGGDERDVQ